MNQVSNFILEMALKERNLPLDIFQPKKKCTNKERLEKIDININYKTL